MGLGGMPLHPLVNDLAVLGLLALVGVVLAGHAGAQAVFGDQ